MKNTLLHTERLTLRAINPDIYDHIFSLPENETKKFFGFKSDEELQIERERYMNGLRTHNKSFTYFQIIEKKSDRIIGWCGFHTWYLDHDRAELGYGLSSDDFKRLGYMTEAIPPILNYGFNELGLHRIEAFASPQNVPSVKLLLSNRFKREGLMKEHYLVNGVYEDSEVFALLKSNSSRKK